MITDAERIMRQALMTAQEWTDKAIADCSERFDISRDERIKIVKAQIMAAGMDEIAMAILELADAIRAKDYE